jgi:hypothetical protein
MSPAPCLTVDVVDDRDIIVAMPASGFEVTYRRDGYYTMLVATDALKRDDRDFARIQFLAKAWKAAHCKARALGWLDS